MALASSPVSPGVRLSYPRHLRMLTRVKEKETERTVCFLFAFEAVFDKLFHTETGKQNFTFFFSFFISSLCLQAGHSLSRP